VGGEGGEGVSSSESWRTDQTASRSRRKKRPPDRECGIRKEKKGATKIASDCDGGKVTVRQTLPLWGEACFRGMRALESGGEKGKKKKR